MLDTPGSQRIKSPRLCRGMISNLTADENTTDTRQRKNDDWTSDRRPLLKIVSAFSIANTISPLGMTDASLKFTCSCV